MSIIFGMRKPIQTTVTDPEILLLSNLTKRFASDRTQIYSEGRFGVGLQQNRTHKRSLLDSGPLADSHDNVVAFDGRLDNYQELCAELELRHDITADAQMVLAAFGRWGEACFARLVGDWAIALWCERTQLLYLARDHAGTRSLYYSNSDGTVRWGTYLETFFADGQFYPLDEQYASCFLCCAPTRDLTPYKGITAVPPAHYLVVSDTSVKRVPHWDWMGRGKIIYSSDEEYDEHFISLFRHAVLRRTGRGDEVLAQLSGGMDSTSIVCMSDSIRRAEGAGPADLLDTISFYNDQEPNWDERPYFSLVEAKRGKTGIHIDTSSAIPSFEPQEGLDQLCLLPGADSGSIARETKFHQSLGVCRA